jgi:hypothetical protein
MQAVLRVVELLVVIGRPVSAHHEDVFGIPSPRLEMRADRFQQQYQALVQDEILRVTAFLLGQKFLDAESWGDLRVFVVLCDLDEPLRRNVNRIPSQRCIGVKADLVLVQQALTDGRVRHHHERRKIGDGLSLRVRHFQRIHAGFDRRFPGPLIRAGRRQCAVRRVHSVEALRRRAY